MKTLLKLLFVFMMALGCLTVVNAQSSKQQKRTDAVKTMIDGVNYVFKATYVNPQRGPGRALTSEYDVVVSKDTVVAYLPYFGRAHVAPINPYSNEGGIKFTSTKFDYKVTTGKKGGWEILIKPKGNNIGDMKDVQQLKLTVSSSGYATLFVLSTNRDPISFNGTVEAGKQIKQ
jgi:hypothetical protein